MFEDARDWKLIRNVCPAGEFLLVSKESTTRPRFESRYEPDVRTNF
jgi:hypothetical protein